MPDGEAAGRIEGEFLEIRRRRSASPGIGGCWNLLVWLIENRAKELLVLK